LQQVHPLLQTRDGRRRSENNQQTPMTRNSHNHQAGFSAIELLITLFIAAAFIAAGYQLYSIIIKNGGEARQETAANNIAYDMLRRYSADVPQKCNANKVPSPTPTIPADSGLPAGATVVVSYACPYGTASSVSKITATVQYGTPQKGVTHVIYASNY
jgi:prepilin-type N-terminal cleavage/methylation domain-containing protein